MYAGFFACLFVVVVFSKVTELQACGGCYRVPGINLEGMVNSAPPARCYKEAGVCFLF